MTKEYIRIIFNNGQHLELGEECLGKERLTVHGHFTELIKAKRENKPYKSNDVYLETTNIDSIIFVRD